MRLPSAVHAGILATLVLTFAGRPVAAQPPPPPPPVPRPAVPAGQAGQPRDPGRRPPPEPVGTGVIRGMVVAADTGTPIRRASVNLVAMPPTVTSTAAGAGLTGGPGGGRGAVPVTTTTQTIMLNGVPTVMNVNAPLQMSMVRPKTMITDGQGAFAFTGLPAGSYRVTANPGQYSAQYLGMAYGAKRPNGPTSSDMGTPIQLADGQSFDKAMIGLPRGSVITGRVTDEMGDPLARVQVYPMYYPPGSSRGQRTGGGDSTDDLGQYRIYGLTPGDYVVVAEARPNTFVQPNAPPETEEEKVGFMTSFYPGTADEAAAQRVRVRGGETPGIEIRVVSGRLFRVSGMITDSKGQPGRANGSISRVGSTVGMNSYGFSTDEQGRFQMKNIAPGSYRLTVRQNQTGPRNPDGSPVDQGEFATMPLSVEGDLENLMIITNPGVTITGQIVFQHGPPETPSAGTPQPIRVMAQVGNPMDNMGMGLPMPSPAIATPDYTFTMKGLTGELLLRANASMQYLKSVTVNGADITDTPHQFKAGDKVVITLTSRASTVEGNVTDAEGKPVTEAGLFLFSDDKASWRSNSIKTRRAAVDQNGHYRMTGLLPGRYFAIAVPRDRLNFSNPDAAFFEELAKEATTVVVGEDEQRQVDLKLLQGPGGN